MSAVAGRVLTIHKGAYDPSATYNPLDGVFYQGSSYLCKQTSQGNLPTNTTYWQIWAQGTAAAVAGNYYGECASAANVQNKVVSVSNDQNFTLQKGAILGVKFTYTNTFSASALNHITLNVNSEGAYPIYFGDTEDPTGTNPVAFGKADFIHYYLYDGVHWIYIANSGVQTAEETPFSAPGFTATNAKDAIVEAAENGGLLPHVVVSVETGSTVTLTKGGTTITATETSSGVYEADIDSYGSWTVTASKSGATATDTLTVDTVKVYNVTLAYFTATITVTYPVGSTCTCTGNGQTQTAQSNPETFTVYAAGTYTLTATDGVDATTKTVTITTDGQTESVTLSYIVKFAFHYSEDNSSPASVTYPSGYDNSNFTDPFYVDLTTGTPHYGDWDFTDPKLSWLLPKSCMLKYDGTVDYYLDESDETKKADGVTASDVADMNYNGNAMMEWGQNGKKIYWKIVPDSIEQGDTDSKGFTFIVADGQVDSDFKPWNHYDCDGNISDHFYTPKYFGSSDGTRLRSISGGTNYVNHTRTEEATQAKANNTTAKVEWNTEVYVDWLFLAMLCTLISKSTDSQGKFGYGYANANSSAIGQGTMNGRGLFYGENTGKYGVKVFGMENRWGNIWRAIAGLINDKGTVKIKLTHSTADGSSANGYNEDGTGYINHGTIGGGTSGGYISHMNITDKGITPNTMSGGDSTYYCDSSSFNNSQVEYAVVGGGWGGALTVGCFCCSLAFSVSYSYAGMGAALSCKPLAS